MIVVVEKARVTDFTTLAKVKNELALTDVNADRDDVLSRMIEDASAAIVTYCDRAFAREDVTEQLQGYDRTIMMLDRTPLVLVREVRYKGAVVSPASGFDNDAGWRMQDPSAGFLFRQDLFTSTQPRQTFIETEIMPMQGRQDWHVDYVGGYLMPGENLVASGVMSAAASDNSFNLPEDDDTYFPIIVAGETIRMSGFTESANNGKHVVVSRTPTKLVVESTLVDEPASGIHRLTCSTLPADLERRCIETVKAWFLWVKRDTSITAERLGDWQASYASAPFLAADNYGLPPIVLAGLQKWARVV
jgi:hypothetical protein